MNRKATGNMLPQAANLVGGFFPIHRNKDDNESQSTLMKEFHSFSFSNAFSSYLRNYI